MMIGNNSIKNQFKKQPYFKLRNLFLSANLLLTAGLGYSQDAKLELEQKPPVALPNSISVNETVRSRMEQFVKSQGMRKGDFQENGRTILVNFGNATIAAPASDPNFVQARINAFNKAMLDAKSQCAEFQKTKIKTESILDMGAPPDSRIKADAERLQREGLAQEGAIKVAQALNSDIKAKNAPATIQTASLYGEKILNNKMNEELRKKGLDPSKPIDQQQVKAILETANFKNAISTVAAARCTGIKAMASFEQNPSSGQGSVGVVTVWTEKLHTIADAIVTGEYSLIPKESPGKPVTDHIPQDVRTLLTTYGAQIVKDETGNYVILAFAQAQPRTKNQQSIDLAYAKAKTLAFGLVRSFMGEAVSVTADMLDREESSVMEDETTKFQDESSYSKKMSAVGDLLPIRGLSEVHSWETLHPANNGPVVGVVAQWKVSSAEIAATLKKMNKSSGVKASAATEKMNSGSSGNSSVTPPKISNGSSPKGTNPYSGQGAASRDF